jgi:hypothetical protein
MEEIITHLVEHHYAEGNSEAAAIVRSMRSRVAAGEDLEDVFRDYDLELDDTIDFYD